MPKRPKQQLVLFTVRVEGQHVQIFLNGHLFHDFGSCPHCKIRNFVYSNEQLHDMVSTFLKRRNLEPVFEFENPANEHTWKL